jgi:LPS-assembly lipoprotein
MKTGFERSAIMRRLRLWGFLAISAWALSACGFHLRGAVELPEQMNTVYAQGFGPASPFPSYLSENLKQSDARLTLEREDAGIILNAINEQFNRREVSLSETGKANIYELSYVLTYDLRNSSGDVILGKQTITVVRDYFNPQVEVIGKSTEEGVIRKEMYQEAVRNLLRRFEVVLRDRSKAR